MNPLQLKKVCTSLRVSSGATAFSAQLKVFEWFISKAFAEILRAFKAVKHKNEYIVNGGKIFITNAGEAGLLSFTSQVIEDNKNLGIAAFIIPTDTPGLEIGNKEKKMGWRASDTRQLYFKDMRIPMESMLGSPENGFKTFLNTLTSGRIAIGALSIGTAVGAYEKALQYSQDRKAFNKNIHQFQSVAFKLSDMATKIEASKLLVYHAAWLKDNGKPFNK